METDFDLGSICNVASKNDTNIVKFFVNLGFENHLDPCKNNKFPGSMVVSVSRKDITLIKGIPMTHIPYKETEIFAWLNPVERKIPPLTFPDYTQRLNNPSVIIHPKPQNSFDNLDFGDSLGYFEVLTPNYVSWNDLDFGGKNGMFEIG